MKIDRRGFIASGAIAGWLTNMAASDFALAAGESLTKAELPTPALLVDLDRFEANLRTMADFCHRASCNLRPHAKTHKCPAIARRQIATGAVGICAATVPEVEALVAASIPGVLLTSPIVEPTKIARMTALLARGSKVMLSIGHLREAELLAEACRAAKVEVDVLVDVDVGDHRTGITPGVEAVELARQMERTKVLHVRGVQAYAGSASHVVGYDARLKTSRELMAKAVETRSLLNHAGFDAAILSGGSTGTYNIDSAMAGMTELQAGSYVFMDLDYQSIGGRDGAIYQDFQSSLTVLATVVSTGSNDRISVDAGTKALDTTTSHRPQAVGWPGLQYNRGGDEFGILKPTEPGAKLPKIGERIEFVVPHCDPTVALYERIYATRGDRVEEVWPIFARRES